MEEFQPGGNFVSFQTFSLQMRLREKFEVSPCAKILPYA